MSSHPVPMEVYLRLARVADLTGTPEGTLRDACNAGSLRGHQVARAWHTTLEAFNEWIEAESARRRDLRTTTLGAMEGGREDGGAEDQRRCSSDPAGSPGKPRRKAKKPSARRTRNKPVIWDSSAVVASLSEPPSANYPGHLQILDGGAGEGPLE